MNATKKSGSLKRLLIVWIMALTLMVSGCNFLDKGERSNVVIKKLTAGEIRVSHYGGDQIQYTVWITCRLENKSEVSASITPDWKFQIDEDITIDVSNSRSYFNDVRVPAIIEPSEEVLINLEYFDDTLEYTKFSEDFFGHWHDVKATITIKDENDHSYRVSETSRFQ